jgi:hypothetical protein
LNPSLSPLEPEQTSLSLLFACFADETSPLITTDVATAFSLSTTVARTDREFIILYVVPDTADSKRLRRRDTGGFIGS